LILLLAILIGFGLLGSAVWKGEIKALEGAFHFLRIGAAGVVLLLLLYIGSRLAREFHAAIERDGPPRFERHWGGLGGMVSGWLISRSMVLLLGLVLVFGGILAALTQVNALSSHFSKSPSSPSVVTNAPAANPPPAEAETVKE
jgi:hypothetical protein